MGKSVDIVKEAAASRTAYSARRADLPTRGRRRVGTLPQYGNLSALVHIEVNSDAFEQSSFQTPTVRDELSPRLYDFH